MDMKYKHTSIFVLLILLFSSTSSHAQITPPQNFDSWSSGAIEWAYAEIKAGSVWIGSDGIGRCLNFVACAFHQNKNSWAGYTDVMQMVQALRSGNKLYGQRDLGWTEAPRGALIFFGPTQHNRHGHVGIHLGDGSIIHAFGKVKTIKIIEAPSLKDKGNLVVGPYIGWSYPPESWRPAAYSDSTSTSVSTPTFSQPTQPLQVTLTLYVRDGSSRGPNIPGAQVTVRDASGSSFLKTTDSNGFVVISGSPGTWQFTASKQGYVQESWSQVVTGTSTRYAFLQKETIPSAKTSDSTVQLSGSKIGDYVQPTQQSSSGLQTWGSQPKGMSSPAVVEETSSQSSSGLEGWGSEPKGMERTPAKAPSSSSQYNTGNYYSGTVTLTLYVRDGSPSGPVIYGAQVTGRDGAGNSFYQTTNSNGYVVITGSAGIWHFTATKPGYAPISWSQEITAPSTKHAFLMRNDAPTSYISDSNIAGKWAFRVQFISWESSGTGIFEPGEDNTYDSTIDFHIDGTFTEQHNSDYIIRGEWVQEGNKIRLQYSPMEGLGSVKNLWISSAALIIDGDAITGTKNELETYGSGINLLYSLSGRRIGTNPLVSLTLYVRDGSPSGPIIPGAQVTGRDAAGNSFYHTTDSNGFVIITGSPGTWHFTVTKPGYASNSWSQEITGTSTKHAYLMISSSNQGQQDGVGVNPEAIIDQWFREGAPGLPRY